MDDQLALETFDAIRQQTIAIEHLVTAVDDLRGLIATGLAIQSLPELPVPVVQAPTPLVVPAPQVTVEPSVVDLTPLYELLDRPTTDEQTVLLLRQMLGQLEQIPKSQVATWSAGITDKQLRASPLPVSGTVTATQGTSPWVVRDDYQTGEVLADQTGAAGVLTFTFSAAVQMIVVFANGATTDIARVDPFGGTPSATLGIPAGDEAALYLPVVTSSVKIFAPVGMVVSVAGLRRV